MPDSYQITGTLPTGLNFDTSTGTITGRPTDLSPLTSYAVTATNAGGSTTVLVTIAINDVQPSRCTYSTSPISYTKGQIVETNALSCAGGPLTSASVNTPLPAGLYLVTSGSASGTVVGTPTALSPAIDYTITASNSGGFATAVLSISVKAVNPDGAIATGRAHACALVDGGVFCWGANSGGQLGNGSTTGSPVPVQVSGLASRVHSLAAGNSHTCATADGGISCWGYNGYGQLGNGSIVSSLVPVPVSGLASGVHSLVVGSYHTCATVNGGVRCWGNNDYGQLGNGSTVGSPVPVVVSGLASGALSLTAGSYHTCATVDGGGVRCWGNNGYGQLGNGSTVDSPVPVAVSGLASGALSLAAGDSNTCATVGGGVRCWGNNGYGQLGNGSTVGNPVPVVVSGLASGVLSLAAGGYHTCATVDGGVRCWGYNYSGQLGNGSTVDSPVPVAVSGLASGVLSLAAGDSNTCATVGGGVRCWGIITLANSETVL